MLGHDGGAYANPNYRRLLHNAILWTAAESKKNRATEASH
jgi:type 1 glutamine amidotransferase